MPKTDYNKLRTKVLGIIEGLALVNPDYNELRRLLIFSENIHSGSRKDGTREFSHQLEMVAFAITFHQQLDNPLAVYKAIIAHDLIEDYPEVAIDLRVNFPSVEHDSRLLSKYQDSTNHELPYTSYFEGLANSPVCSIAKLIDRVHNLSTAPGVFSTEKLRSYCVETETYYFDLIRQCKELYSNRGVYENLKFILTTQVNTIQKLLPPQQVGQPKPPTTTLELDSCSALSI